MMLAQQIDMQWYCVELARSFNDLSTVIANGDYLHDTLCDKSHNLHGEYDFSDEKLQDSVGLDLTQIVGLKLG